jgi:hypothetical protein
VKNGIALLILTLIGGCSYHNEKALRDYNAELIPVRSLIQDLARYQGYMNEKKTPERIRQFTVDEILSRARRITSILKGIRSKHERVIALNEQFTRIWEDYIIGFEVFSEDLSNINLEPRKRRIRDTLERCSIRWLTWKAELLSFHESAAGWAG